jgi:hypothetical protein
LIVPLCFISSVTAAAQRAPALEQVHAGDCSLTIRLDTARHDSLLTVTVREGNAGVALPIAEKRQSILDDRIEIELIRPIPPMATVHADVTHGDATLPLDSTDGRSPISVAGDRVTVFSRRQEWRPLLAESAGDYRERALPGDPAAQQLAFASQFFPISPHWSLRADALTPVTFGVAHGDGGFTDYTGVTALLARQVHNILLVENSDGPVEEDAGLRSLFQTLPGLTDTGDKSRNVVFSGDKHQELVTTPRAEGVKGPAVACFTNCQVLKNEFYNIRQSGEELNICFV